MTRMSRIVPKTAFSLLNTDYVQLNKNWNYKHVISPFYRLYLIDKGAGWLSSAQESIQLEPDFLYLIPSFTLCNYRCDSFLSQYYLQFLEESVDGSSLFASHRKLLKVKAREEDPAIFKRILSLNPNRGLTKYDPREYEKRTILQSFQDLNNLMNASDLMETNGLILQLLSRFLRPGLFKPLVAKPIPSKVMDAVNYIQTNLHQQLTVDGLAIRAGLNADYFSRIFKEHTGERPLTYIQFKRVERAQLMLIESAMSIQDIALETGFESLSYFSRIFKSLTGQAPGEYKRNNSF